MVGRSNDTTFEFQKSKMGACGHLGYTKMAITSQRLCRSTWYLVLGWGFRLSLDFYHRGLHTRTAVARNPCVSWAFLFDMSIQPIHCCARIIISLSNFFIHYCMHYLKTGIYTDIWYYGIYQNKTRFDFTVKKNKSRAVTKIVQMDVLFLYSVSQRNPNWRLVAIVPRQLGIFQPNFKCLLRVPIYARLRIFIQLSAILTKLYHIKRDHPVHIVCAKCPPSAETHAGIFWHFIQSVRNF